jgi:hypothetical protein
MLGTKEKQMKNASLFLKHEDTAKQAGMFTSYWSNPMCGQSNDRTPEITQGSLEDRVK